MYKRHPHAAPRTLSSSVFLCHPPGNARFTVLTDNVIRMEYSSKAQFEDRPTLAVLNRNLTVPKFSSATSGGVLTITTSALPESRTSLLILTIAVAQRRGRRRQRSGAP